MSLTREQFQNLTEDEKWMLYDKTAELREMLATALGRIDACESRITVLESELAITSNVNTTLAESIKKLNRKINRLDQYGRRENLVISNFPICCDDTEGKVISILKKINCPVSKSEISACHPLKKKSSIIVRFVKRKSADRILSARKN